MARLVDYPSSSPQLPPVLDDHDQFPGLLEDSVMYEVPDELMSSPQRQILNDIFHFTELKAISWPLQTAESPFEVIEGSEDDLQAAPSDTSEAESVLDDDEFLDEASPVESDNEQEDVLEEAYHDEPDSDQPTRAKSKPAGGKPRGDWDNYESFETLTPKLREVCLEWTQMRYDDPKSACSFFENRRTHFKEAVFDSVKFRMFAEKVTWKFIQHFIVTPPWDGRSEVPAKAIALFFRDACLYSYITKDPQIVKARSTIPRVLCHVKCAGCKEWHLIRFALPFVIALGLRVVSRSWWNRAMHEDMTISHLCHHFLCLILTHITMESIKDNKTKNNCTKLARRKTDNGQTVPETCESFGFHGPPFCLLRHAVIAWRDSLISASANARNIFDVWTCSMVKKCSSAHMRFTHGVEPKIRCCLRGGPKQPYHTHICKMHAQMLPGVPQSYDQLSDLYARIENALSAAGLEMSADPLNTSPPCPTTAETVSSGTPSRSVSTSHTTPASTTSRTSTSVSVSEALKTPTPFTRATSDRRSPRLTLRRQNSNYIKPLYKGTSYDDYID